MVGQIQLFYDTHLVVSSTNRLHFSLLVGNYLVYRGYVVEARCRLRPSACVPEDPHCRLPLLCPHHSLHIHSQHGGLPHYKVTHITTNVGLQGTLLPLKQ